MVMVIVICIMQVCIKESNRIEKNFFFKGKPEERSRRIGLCINHIGGQPCAIMVSVKYLTLKHRAILGYDTELLILATGRLVQV